jgi:beta-alanine degradation protein BauB
MMKALAWIGLGCSCLLHSEEISPVETHRVFQFENEHVRVWKTVIMPHQPLKMHRHDYARVLVGLKGGSLKKIEATGETSDLNFETGAAYWLTKDPAGSLHADVNESHEPIEVMVIELKSLEKND